MKVVSVSVFLLFVAATFVVGGKCESFRLFKYLILLLACL